MSLIEREERMKNELIDHKIPAHTAAWLEITGAVMDIVNNTYVFIGALDVCYGFDFSNDKYMTVEL